MTQLLALLISWLIEIPIVLITLVITKQLSSHRDICNSLFIAFAATLFTHPLAWESNQILTSYIKFPLRVAVIESFVMIIEGILYTKFLKLSWRKGLLLSILANTVSFLVGFVINQLFYS